MTMLAQIQAEIARERCQGHKVRRIRVTPAAFQGMPTCLPIQSKRWQLGVTPETRVEMIMHPSDWRALLNEISPEVSPQWSTVLGMPVLEERP